MDIELTNEEEKIIKSLKRLAKRWPKTLWLYSASGTLCLMKCKEDGVVAYTQSGGIDPDYRIAEINIDNDGGDW